MLVTLGGQGLKLRNCLKVDCRTKQQIMKPDDRAE